MTDPLDELLGCLDVLSQDLLYRTQHVGTRPAHPIPRVPNAELYAALWQTGELVGALLQDSAQAWDAVMGLRGIVNELQGKLAERDSGLVDPHGVAISAVGN